MKRKTKLLRNFNFFDPNGGNDDKRNSKSMQFFFLKTVKIEPANKDQNIFPKEMSLVPIKHHFSYLSFH
jgi:hypothetical protein